MSTAPLGPRGISWRTSKACDAGACVGVGRARGRVYVGNTSDPEGFAASFTRHEWRAFIIGVKAGEFDDFAL